jgi:hypothetical protein
MPASQVRPAHTQTRKPLMPDARPRRTAMCNLIEHTERDQRQQQAKRLEPIYANLADERGIPYQGPEQGPFFCPETEQQ